VSPRISPENKIGSIFGPKVITHLCPLFFIWERKGEKVGDGISIKQLFHVAFLREL
jgi:hypothetical protein